MKPYGYEAGKKYPLVLYIHGGPHSAYGEGWFDEFQNLAGAGMWVLFTNPRGSSGYGADFTYTTRGRWGAEDYEDLMKAVDIAVASARRRLDAHGRHRRLVRRLHDGVDHDEDESLQGGAGRPHDQRLDVWYGASDAQGLTEFEFYGKPWDNLAMYDHSRRSATSTR